LTDTVALVFAEALRIVGINAIVLSRRFVRRYLQGYKMSSERILHRIANLVITNRAQICRDTVWGVPIGFFHGVEVLYDVRASKQGEAVVRSQYEPCPNDVSERVKNIFLSLFPRIPLFIIDLGLWELHSETERNELFKQLLVVIDTVREYFTDLNLMLVATPRELKMRINSILPSHEIAILDDYEIYSGLDSKHVIVLDPYAEQCLDEKTIRKAHIYILGGIIDEVFPRPYATKTLVELHALEAFPRYSLKLWGSTVGVPNRINKIIEIITSVRYGKSLEQAIIESMSTEDKIARILHEIHKRFGKERRVAIQQVLDIMRLFNLSEKFIHRIVSSLKSFEIKS